MRKEDWRSPSDKCSSPKTESHPGAAIIAIVSLPQGSEVDVYDFVMVSEPKCGPTFLEKQD